MQHWQFTVHLLNSVWHRSPSILSYCSWNKITHLSFNCFPRISLGRGHENTCYNKKKKKKNATNQQKTDTATPISLEKYPARGIPGRDFKYICSCPAEQQRSKLKIQSGMLVFFSSFTVYNPARVQTIPTQFIKGTFEFSLSEISAWC